MDPLYHLSELGDCGAVSWQERAPSPGIPISFTQENPILRPPSPIFFPDYFDGPTGLDEMLYPQIQGHADGSVQPNDLFAFSDNNSIPSPGLPQQGDQLPMQSYVWPGLSNFNHLLDTPLTLQTSPLSKHQKYRLRLKAKEQTKNRDIEILKQQILMKDEQLARLTWEIDMLKNNENKKIVRLTSEIEMLREEITSINHNNLPIH
ncbi:hypothetical protein V6N11_064286 [Hibiscus sabdariffa]|uniref:BZIP domain-containing protein n=1 Tax=Hibiscus sabdariffa TaxID=183260 RepID=A0ABR2PN44_9ROSI